MTIDGPTAVAELYQHSATRHAVTLSLDGDAAHAICTPLHLVRPLPSAMFAVRKPGASPLSCVPFGRFEIAAWRLEQLRRAAAAPPDEFRNWGPADVFAVSPAELLKASAEVALLYQSPPCRGVSVPLRREARS